MSSRTRRRAVRDELTTAFDLVVDRLEALDGRPPKRGELTDLAQKLTALQFVIGWAVDRVTRRAAAAIDESERRK